MEGSIDVSQGTIENTVEDQMMGRSCQRSVTGSVSKSHQESC